MYRTLETGVLKSVESWSIMLPLHDNEGKDFQQAEIDQILEDISLSFPGFTLVNCVGYWKGEERTYVDRNFQIIVDVFDAGEDLSGVFMALKDRLKTQLQQDKIYVTKQTSKEEFLSFAEFFTELGLEDVPVDASQARELAQQLSQRFEFVQQRLGYETLFLRRYGGRITWERSIAGIRLRSEWEDVFPEKVAVLAADQIDDIVELLGTGKPYVVLGNYEYQFHILDTVRPRRLVSDINPIVGSADWTYFSPSGDRLTTEEFINAFVTSVFVNCAVLIDEGYQPAEMQISIGSDGSMQLGQRAEANIMYLVPATIPQKEVQLESLRCLEILLENYGSGSKIDTLALLQAKARDAYGLKRAMLRKLLQHRGAWPNLG